MGTALPEVGVDMLRRLLSMALANPEIAAAVVVVAAALVAGLYAIRQFTRPRGARFLEAVSELDEVAVLLHPNPDPDAMATGMGVASLAEQVDTDAQLQYPGQIRHQENRAFRTVLDVDIETIDHVSDVAAEHVVLVDHNEPRGFAGADSVLPFAVVDHHPGEGGGGTFTDVRTDYGAASSIVGEYFDDLGALAGGHRAALRHPDRHEPAHSRVLGRRLRHCGLHLPGSR